MIEVAQRRRGLTVLADGRRWTVGQRIVARSVDLKTALALGATKYVFKIVIAAIDTLFIYWARATFRRRAAPEPA